MKNLTTALSGALAAVLCTAPAIAAEQSVTYDGFLPGLFLEAFYDVDNAGAFDATEDIVQGLPKFDPALGTLTDVQISFFLDYSIDAFLDGNGIVDDGLPHQIDTTFLQLALGLTYQRADGGVSGFVEVLEGFQVSCFGDAFSGDGCQEQISIFEGFGANNASVFDDVAPDAVIGEGDVEIFGVEIAFIDPFFDLFNIVNFTLDMTSEIIEETATVSITYVYDDGVSDPDTDGDGVP